MAWIIIASSKQPLIAFLHQLNKVWQICLAVSTSLAPAKRRLDALFVCTFVQAILQICMSSDYAIVNTLVNR